MSDLCRSSGAPRPASRVRLDTALRACAVGARTRFCEAVAPVLGAALTESRALLACVISWEGGPPGRVLAAATLDGAVLDGQALQDLIHHPLLASLRSPCDPLPALAQGSPAPRYALAGLPMGQLVFAYADAATARSSRNRSLVEAVAHWISLEWDRRGEQRDETGLEQALGAALHTPQLFNLYQPIISVAQGRIAGFEALVRWKHPTLGVVRPDRFIGLAEETGMIVPLGEQVFEAACRDLRRLDALQPDHRLYINVNFSRKQLIQPDVVERVRRIARDTGVDTTRIHLEITESIMMDSRDTIVPVLDGLRRLGFGLAMDDFGTGHSSLACLHQFPVDKLKLDRSFVRSLSERAEFFVVVRAIVTLAHALGLSVVAEGIETEDQHAVLRMLACDELQGYLFARPLVFTEAVALVRGQMPLRASA